MMESISQLYRALSPIQLWLVYLIDSYQGTEKIMGVILSAAYMVAKGADLLQRAKFCKVSAVKLLQKTVRITRRWLIISLYSVYSIIIKKIDCLIKNSCFYLFSFWHIFQYYLEFIINICILFLYLSELRYDSFKGPDSECRGTLPDLSRKLQFAGFVGVQSHFLWALHWTLVRAIFRNWNLLPFCTKLNYVGCSKSIN